MTNKKKGIPSKKDKNTPTPPKFNFYWIYAIIMVGLLVMAFFPKEVGKKTTLKEVLAMVQSQDVEKIVVNNDRFVEVYLTEEALENEKYKEIKEKSGLFGASAPHFTFESNFEYFVAELDKLPKSDTKELRIEQTHTKDYSPWFSWIIMIALFIFFWMFIMKRMGGGGGSGGPGQLFNIGKSKAQLFDKNTKVNTTFKDVAGLEEAKVEVKEIVDFLKNPKKYTDLGGKIPKGALLVGPPGTGKTLLAKAVAGEAEVPFFSLSGSDFVEMFVGVGASRVRDLFKQAREKSPAIIFIDEIDAIGRARGKNSMQGGNDERENTLNQLLTEMDGFGTDSGVIILAATNRVDVLDSALLRAGRFDRQVFVDMPDLNERRAIFDVHIKPIKIEKGLDIDFLAKQTPGFSGADIANMCNEAALIAARKDKKVVEKQDFLDAVDRIVGGLEKKNKIIAPEEKRAVAFHEAGHATVSWMLEHANPLIKVTIVPRGRSLGAAWYLPEERQITTTEQLLDEMCAALGGRAAEYITFGKISTGALSDLEKVTKQAMAMVSIYGLNDKVGNVSYYNLDNGFSKPYSEKTAALIDDEIKNLTDTQYQRAIKILTENKEKMTLLAEKLLEKEVIFKEDLELIFGKRPFDKENIIEVKSSPIPTTPEPIVAPETENEITIDTPPNDTPDEEANTEEDNIKE